MARSAFGVDDSRISKASPDGSALHVLMVPTAASKKERRRKALTAAAIGGAVSAAGGTALRLGKLPIAVTTAISGGGSAAQSLTATRPPKSQQ